MLSSYDELCIVTFEELHEPLLEIVRLEKMDSCISHRFILNSPLEFTLNNPL